MIKWTYRIIPILKRNFRFYCIREVLVIEIIRNSLLIVIKESSSFIPPLFNNRWWSSFYLRIKINFWLYSSLSSWRISNYKISNFKISRSWNFKKFYSIIPTIYFTFSATRDNFFSKQEIILLEFNIKLREGVLVDNSSCGINWVIISSIKIIINYSWKTKCNYANIAAERNVNISQCKQLIIIIHWIVTNSCRTNTDAYIFN